MSGWCPTGRERCAVPDVECECERMIEERVCHRCFKPLKGKTVWLNLSTRTGLYTAEAVPEAEDQGGWVFGADCARVVLRNNGNLSRTPAMKRRARY